MSTLRTVFDAYRSAYGDLPRSIWILSLALFVNRFGTMVLPFLMLYLTRERHYGAATAGYLLSVYGIGSIVGTGVAGYLVDRVGAIRLQILLLVASVPMFLVIPFCQTPGQIGIALLVLSLFSEGVRPANATAIALLTPPMHQTRAFALQRTALNLGISFGPAIGGLLTTIDFFWLFVADAATTAACVLVIIGYFGWRPIGKTDDPAPGSDVPEGKGSANTFGAKGGGTSSTRGHNPWTDVPYLVFLALMLCSALVFFQFMATYPLYMTERYGFQEYQLGFLYAVNTIVIVLFEMVLVQYVGRWSILRVIAWGGFFSCFGFGILPFGSSVAWAVVSMLVLTLGEMLASPLATGWVAARAAPTAQGRYMGLYTMTYSVASVLAPAIGGWMYAHAPWTIRGWVVNGPDSIWYAGLGIAAVVVVGYLLLDWIETPHAFRERRRAVSCIECQDTENGNNSAM